MISLGMLGFMIKLAYKIKIKMKEIKKKYTMS